MPTLEFQAIVNSLQSAIFTPGNLVTVSAMTTVANVPVLDLTVNQIDTDSFTLDETTTPPTLRITAHPEQSPWHSPIDAAGFYVFDIQYIQFADGTIQTTAFNAGTIGQTPWLQDIDAFNHNLINLNTLRFTDLSIQTTAFKGVAFTQTPWLQQVHGGGFDLIGVGYIKPGGVEIRPVAGQYPFTVRNSADTGWNWIIDLGGELVTQTGRTISGIGAVSFADTTIQTTAYLGIAATQTPWLQNINAAGHSLSNVAVITCNGLTVQQNDITIQQGAINIIPAPGANAFRVYDSGATLLRWYIDTSGNLLAPQHNGISDIGSIRFADNSVQTTAYIAGSGAQTPWLQNIDGARKTLSQVGQIIIWPVAGVQRFGITNDAGSGWDWLVDSTGNLSSATFKSILTLGSIGFADTTVQTTAYLGVAATQTPWKQNINGAGFSLTSAGAAVDVACLVVHGIAATNRLLIFDTSGGLEWFIDPNGHFSSNTGRNISTTGTISGLSSLSTAQLLLGGDALVQPGKITIVPVAGQPALNIFDAPTTSVNWSVDLNGNLTSPAHKELSGVMHVICGDGVNRSAVLSQQVGLILGHLKPIDWSAGPDYFGTIDLRLTRASAGVLSVLNPSTAAYADFNCHALTASNVIRAAAIIVGPSGDVRSDTFSITGFGTGITGTFTTAGGQTVTVRGGIILSIV